MLHGIGTDIVNISRVVGLADRYNGRFLRKFLHQEEIREYDKIRRAHPNRAGAFLASRWSAKEALTKAFGTGRFLFPDVKVDKSPSGAPTLSLHGTARDLAEELGIFQTLVSLSHESEYAVAFVTALKPLPNQNISSPQPQQVIVNHPPIMTSPSVQNISPDAKAWLAASGISASAIPPLSQAFGHQSPMTSQEEGLSVFDELYDYGFEKPK